MLKGRCFQTALPVFCLLFLRWRRMRLRIALPVMSDHDSRRLNCNRMTSRTVLASWGRVCPSSISGNTAVRRWFNKQP
ncbi:hypothetical protein NEIELOOT_02689 [Neisseria elongata subsp. glycolytica ATCC 29315]|uniref:Uncharacterized protein n=1 Tax=Neisseria elongata subsp. glycolytica ATCC 29315 TaxID=546263 RepID=D4DUD0_NEIEG|nr:hypothetical protein NEIELOOT_02689 [Neisseria elongata subsp. glycolytica ATCC 29315]